jgi:hypothetical protein
MDKSVLMPRLHKSLIGLLILIAVLVLSGCDLLPPEPTVTPTLTATQTETPTPTIDWFPATATPTMPVLPSPTPQPTREDLRPGITTLLVDDDFSDERLWETRQSSLGNIAFGLQNLTLAVASPSTSLTSLSQHNLLEDFYLEMTIQTTLCRASDQIGVLFWQQSQGDYYRLLINCDAQIRLELIQNGQTFVVNDWETAQGMQPGAPALNRLGMFVTRGQLQLYINDNYQFEARILSNRTGYLGVFARTISGDAMTVRFSDLQIYRTEAD